MTSTHQAGIRLWLQFSSQAPQKRQNPPEKGICPKPVSSFGGTRELLRIQDGHTSLSYSFLEWEGDCSYETEGTEKNPKEPKKSKPNISDRLICNKYF